jgi:hypothetical protein
MPQIARYSKEMTKVRFIQVLGIENKKDAASPEREEYEYRV